MSTANIRRHKDEAGERSKAFMQKFLGRKDKKEKDIFEGKVLQLFNRCICYFNDINQIPYARQKAVRLLARPEYGTAIKDLYKYLSERFCHWSNGCTPPKTGKQYIDGCIRIINMLARSDYFFCMFDTGYVYAPNFNREIKSIKIVRTSINPDRIAAISTVKTRAHCPAHPERELGKGARSNFCPACYQRVHYLTMKSVIDNDTPEEAIIEILKLPKKKGPQGALQRSAISIVLKYKTR